MWLEGEFFGIEERDALVAVLREAFDKAIVREFSDNGYQGYEWGPKDMFVNIETARVCGQRSGRRRRARRVVEIL